MPDSFARKKAIISESLRLPQEEYTDLSPKGSLDEGIRDLCNEINSLEDCVTTSSCAGRVTVFLDGAARDNERSSGKGDGGRWLYVSHDPIEMGGLDEEGSIFKLFGIDTCENPSAPPFSESRSSFRFIHFKFEPMILHILISSLQTAQKVLTAAQSAGFRESGISSTAGDNATPLVAVRTQGLALESIIAYLDEDRVRPMVSEDYLRTLIQIANRRFAGNQLRRNRFHGALLDMEAKRQARLDEWEPANLRAARKRAEGLQRREERKVREKVNESNGQSAHDDDDDDGPSSAGLFLN